MIAVLIFLFFPFAILFAAQDSRVDLVSPHNAFVSPFIAMGERPKHSDEILENLRKSGVPAAYAYKPSKNDVVTNTEKMALYKIIPSLEEYARYREAYDANPHEKKAIAGAIAVQIAGSLILKSLFFDKENRKNRREFIKAVSSLRLAKIDEARLRFTNLYKSVTQQMTMALAAQGLCACDLVEDKKIDAVKRAQRVLFLCAKNKINYRLREFFLEIFFTYSDASYVSNIAFKDIDLLKKELESYRYNKKNREKTKMKAIKKFMKFES